MFLNPPDIHSLSPRSAPQGVLFERLQNQLVASRSGCTSFLIPSTAVLPQPFQDIQMTSSAAQATCAVIPTVLHQPLQLDVLLIDFTTPIPGVL